MQSFKIVQNYNMKKSESNNIQSQNKISAELSHLANNHHNVNMEKSKKSKLNNTILMFCMLMFCMLILCMLILCDFNISFMSNVF